MTNKERLEKYKEEYCSKCKNRKSNLCDIRIFVRDKVVYTKCVFYERKENEK